jgi:ribosomal-protein-serine acetyltransferase
MFVHQLDEHTTLAMVEMRDAEELFALVDGSRMYLREWLPWVDANISINETVAFVEAAQRQYSRGEGFQCCIRYRGKIVGIIGIHRVDRFHKQAEIGYWLAEETQGRGIMTSCCRELVDFMFREYKLHRVEIRAAVGNTKSRAIPERLGFKHEGTLREAEWVNDHFVDGAVYSMLEQDWSR